MTVKVHESSLPELSVQVQVTSSPSSSRDRVSPDNAREHETPILSPELSVHDDENSSATAFAVSEMLSVISTGHSGTGAVSS